ncbi:hypothetical protein U0070_012314, partial [Myodes glareolus]
PAKTPPQGKAGGGARAKGDVMNARGRSFGPLPGPPVQALGFAATARAARTGPARQATLPQRPNKADGTGVKRAREQPAPLASPRVIRPACFPGLLAPPLRRRTAALRIRPFSRFEFSLAKREKQSTRMPTEGLVAHHSKAEGISVHSQPACLDILLRKVGEGTPYCASPGYSTTLAWFGPCKAAETSQAKVSKLGHQSLIQKPIKPNAQVLITWGEEGGGRGLQFPGAPVLSLGARKDAAGPWSSSAWGHNRGRRVPWDNNEGEKEKGCDSRSLGPRSLTGCDDVPRTQQLQVREDVNEVSHARVAVDPGPQDAGCALLGALTQPQLCLIAHNQGRCGAGNVRF